MTHKTYTSEFKAYSEGSNGTWEDFVSCTHGLWRGVACMSGPGEGGDAEVLREGGGA